MLSPPRKVDCEVITFFSDEFLLSNVNSSCKLRDGYWSGKHGNIGEFDSCHGIVGEKMFSGRTFIVNFTFAATPVFSGIVIA